MHIHTCIYIHIYISKHVDLSNINPLYRDVEPHLPLKCTGFDLTEKSISLLSLHKFSKFQQCYSDGIQ